MAVIVGVGGLQNWPELLVAILNCLDGTEKTHLEGALDALYKVILPSQTEANVTFCGFSKQGDLPVPLERVLPWDADC